MNRRQRRYKGVALLGAALIATSLLVGCTGALGQDVPEENVTTPVAPVTAPSSVQSLPEENVTPPGGPVPTPSEGKSLPEENETYPAGPVPAPSGGLVSEMVAPVEVPEPIETGLVATASPEKGLTVELSSVEPIETSAPAPGQVSGPALVVTMIIKNTGDEPVDTSGIEISLADSRGNPGSGMIGEPAEWFEGSIDPGAQASGVYVFTVEKSERDKVRVSFSLRPGLPAVVFAGTP